MAVFPENTFLRFGITGIFLIFVAEASLRVIGLGSPLLYVENSVYGYMPAPNQDVYRFFVHIRTNSYGMRSDPVAYEKPTSTHRILFDGDSVTFGTTYVDQANIFTSLIQGYFRQKNIPMEILNASAGGWAPTNELGFIASQGTFHADEVVFVINMEDLVQPFAGYAKGPAMPTENPPSAISETWDRYIEPIILNHLVARDAGSTLSGDPPVETETPKVLETLTKARLIAIQNGARFEIIYSPATSADITLYHAHWEKAVVMLMDWAKQQKVPVIDMTQAYAKYPASEVYYDGIHLRPLGHKLVAQEFEHAYEGEK